MAKRVEDVREGPWTDEGVSEVRRRRVNVRKLKPIKPGRLERNVDAVLRVKGIPLDKRLEIVLDEFNRRASRLKPFKAKRVARRGSKRLRK